MSRESYAKSWLFRLFWTLYWFVSLPCLVSAVFGVMMGIVLIGSGGIKEPDWEIIVPCVLAGSTIPVVLLAIHRLILWIVFGDQGDSDKT